MCSRGNQTRLFPIRQRKAPAATLRTRTCSKTKSSFGSPSRMTRFSFSESAPGTRETKPCGSRCRAKTGSEWSLASTARRGNDRRGGRMVRTRYVPLGTRAVHEDRRPPAATYHGLPHPALTGGESAIQQCPQRVAASIPTAPHEGHSRSCGAGPSASVSTRAVHAARSAGTQSPFASSSSTRATAPRNTSRGSRRVLLLVVVMTAPRFPTALGVCSRAPISEEDHHGTSAARSLFIRWRRAPPARS